MIVYCIDCCGWIGFQGVDDDDVHDDDDDDDVSME